VRVEGLDIALRRRPPWEATDLGVALVRRHLRAIALPWLIVSGIVFIVLNALLLPFDLAWLALLLLWWLKPLFDRIPIYVLARAIMGEVPGVRATLRAQLRESWRPIVPWLLWRRLHPSRSMLMPVDLLEGLRGAARGERVRVLARGEGATPALLWLIGFWIGAMLWASIILFGLMLWPTEFLSDSAKALMDTLFEQPPWWIELINNALYWMVLVVVEPIYVGAGFALYLNRRTQLEAWDIELAFRRMAARLRRLAGTTAIFLALSLPLADAIAATDEPLSKPIAASGAAHGKVGSTKTPDCNDDCKQPQAAPGTLAEANEPGAGWSADDEAGYVETDEDEDEYVDDASEPHEAAAGDPVLLSDLFDDPRVSDGAGFQRAVREAMADPDLSPTEQAGTWRWKQAEDEVEFGDAPRWMEMTSQAVALVVENLLWILLAVAIVLIALSARRWLPWLTARGERVAPVEPRATEERALPVPLPENLADAVLAHWRAGEHRAALSLFYRAALRALVERVGTPLPPGATEADSLRHVRRVAAVPFATAFRRVVSCWQAAAYAHRLPSDEELLALLAAWREAEATP
jgi:hypothetical protein